MIQTDTYNYSYRHWRDPLGRWLSCLGIHSHPDIVHGQTQRQARAHKRATASKSMQSRATMSLHTNAPMRNTALGLAEALLIHSSDSSCGHSAAAGGPQAWEGHQGNEPTTGQTPTPCRGPLQVDEGCNCVTGRCAVAACIIEGSSVQQQVKVHNRCARSGFCTAEWCI